QVRQHRLRKDLSDAASSIHGSLMPDEVLLRGVSEIVEYPSVVLGKFPPEFLNLPSSILACSLREHQKSFCVQGADGKLLPYFLSVANRDLSQNIKARDTITKGNEWVLNARLFDAQFFFSEDT
ncbi:MAG: glycine--tRNA ligase subunit beta, partial [Holophagaceae bacterium]